MKTITVNVPETQMSFFVELLEKLQLKFEESKRPVQEFEIPEWHKKILDQRRNSVKKSEFVKMDVVMKKMKNKYGL
jgi:hypothetical protein